MWVDLHALISVSSKGISNLENSDSFHFSPTRDHHWVCGGAIIREGEDYFGISKPRRGFFFGPFLRDSLAWLKSGDGRFFARAYRTLAAAGAAVDVLRMRKMRKKSERDGRAGKGQ